MQESPIPKPKEGQVLLKLLYLSVDPYMRGRMNDKMSYIEPFKLDEPPTGGAIAQVVESKSPDFKEDEIVEGFLPWSDYSVADAYQLRKLDLNLAPITTALGVLGMPGMTAYFGLLDIGKPKPNETVVVSAAAGAVGELVCQIAKIKGCRVVAITGSDEKVAYLKNDLKVDAAVNYKSQTFKEDLKKAVPDGVDIYFDNVGGSISDAVFELINHFARIIICGQISFYNSEKPVMAPRMIEWMLLSKSALMQGFLVFNYQSSYPQGIDQMAAWIREGKIKYRETIVSGLENTPKAFIGLFTGDNIGKQLVKVDDHQT
jgi:NADPH-dependent curcumin reductase CurA